MKQLLRALLCFVLITNATTSFSQTGYLSVPAPSNLGSFSKANKTTNGYIALGTSGSANASHDIVYLDANFDPQWTLCFPSAVVLIWHDAIELNDGNFLAFGANQNHSGGCNIAIKISPSGAILWQREYYLSGTFLTAFCVSKAAGNDPGFVFGGGACAASSFLIRCDADGNILWQHQYYITGGSGVQSTVSVLAENNAYVLSGNIAFASQNDVYLTKVDSAGNWTWSTVVSEPILNEIPVKTIRLSTGNYAMICQYNSNPNYSQLVYFFNSTGSITGGKKFTGPTQNQIDFKDIVETSGGGTIIVGSMYDPPMKFLYLSLDATGNVLWQNKSIGSPGNFANGMNSAVAKTPQGNFACFGASYYDARAIGIVDNTGAGYCNTTPAGLIASLPDAYTMQTTTPVIIPPNVLTVLVTNANTTLTLTSTNICGAVGVNEVKADELLSVYPNPAMDKITLVMEGKELNTAVVTFWNVLGKQVYVVKGAATPIDISMLEAGVYLMEVVVDGERSVGRVVKE
jgi:hypothetical protein